MKWVQVVFKWLKVWYSKWVKVSVGLFADDTLIVGEKSVHKLWAIKSIIQLFEIASGLKVNFHKSQLIGVNLEDCWLKEAEYLLNCKAGAIPFLYLDFPIGANPRKKSTWLR